MEKKNEIDMLHGPLAWKIMAFAMPLIATGVLQQSFNAVDVAVIGRYCSSQSLAAVGSNGVIISLIINLFMGIGVGANVVIAHFVGRKDDRGVRDAVRTVALLSVVCGLFVMCVGLLAARPLLEVISTPEDVMEPATVYLRIFFSGIPFLLIFNFGAAILRSIGDTRRPFYFLVIGGVINVLLNLLLVIVFDMDVAGVAIATVVSNIVASALMIRLLTRIDGPCRLDLRRIRATGPELSRILKIGLPAGLQGVVFSFSNVFIVSGINTFGAVGSAGSAAALNYEFYCYFVMMAFASASVAFTSQCYAAGDIRRCNRIFALCMVMGIVSTMILNVLIAWQSDFFITFFTTDPDVMGYARIRLEYVLLWQFIAASYEISGSTMRGLGYSMTPTVLTILGTCVVRLIWVYVFHHTGLINGFDELLMVYPVTWVLTGILVLAAYMTVRRKAYAKIEGGSPAPAL